MVNKLSDKGRTIVGIAILLISIIVFGFIITPAGIMISKAGKEMADIRSISGDTVAEAYYQLHGEIYASLGHIIAGIGLACSFCGTVYSIILLKANKETLKSIGQEIKTVTDNENLKSFGQEIKTVTDDVKNRTMRAAREFTNAESCASTESDNVIQNKNVRNAQENSCFCPQCGATINDGNKFCTKCGYGVPTAPKDNCCPACGSRIDDDATFCVKCGSRIKKE